MRTDWKNRMSIQILSRQRNGYLAVLLHSLLEQTHTNWDLCILDNNDEPYLVSNDHLCMSVLRKLMFHKHAVNIIRSTDESIKTNIGLSRNVLLEANKDYKWSVRIDDDSILDVHYLERLWSVIVDRPKETIGAVGGVVPSYAQVDLYKYPPKIFNKIVPSDVPDRYIHLGNKYTDVEGFKNEKEEYYNIGEPIDDGAFLYHPDYEQVVISHHLRSSFLFDTKALLDIGGFPSSDNTGFREETIASIKLIEAGYGLYTQTQAVAWHLWAPNLGRGYNKDYTPDEHEKKILRNEVNFQRGYRKLLRKLFKH